MHPSLSQNHFGSALSQFSSTCLFVFQLTADSEAPLKQCFADLKYQFSLFQIDCGSNGWSRQNVWFWIIFGRPDGSRTNARVVWEFADSPHDNFWTMQAGAILQCSFVHVWIRLQVKQSVVVSALMSFKRLVCSQIKKTLIQIISFIWNIDKRQLNSYS